MINTTADLVNTFTARVGYTQSDEISLVWPAMTEEAKEKGSTFMFNGKVQQSLIFSFQNSSLCSVATAQHDLRTISRKSLVQVLANATKPTSTPVAGM
jgi:hypothetical protein